ncbi:hypothetical protein [Kitasatospora sp. NPDC091207]|uniref:hypothetical protein n=1 Tax=Kitasatospora sp. NPDC091207 TaxID=3364083 RepID=UPI00382BA518
MNRLHRLWHHATHRTDLTCTAVLRGGRTLAAAVERLDNRVIAALRRRVRPLTARLTARLRRAAAANCGDALSRHLPCRARDRAQERWGDDELGRRDAG